MKKNLLFLSIVLSLLMFSFSEVSLGWSGVPTNIKDKDLISTHTELTRLSLLDIAPEDEVKKIAVQSDDPDIYNLIDTFHINIFRMLGIEKQSGFCHRVTKYEKDFRSIRNENMKYTYGAEWGAWYWTEAAKEAYKKNPNSKEWMEYLGNATHFLADALCPPHCRPWLEGLGSGPHLKFERDFASLSRLDKYKNNIIGKLKASFMDGKDIVKWVLNHADEVYKMDQTYVQQGAEERGWYNTLTEKFTTAISYQDKGQKKIYYYNYDSIISELIKLNKGYIIIMSNKKLKENFMQGLSKGEDGKVLIENFKKDLMNLMNINIDYKTLKQIFLKSLQNDVRDIYIFEEENLKKIFQYIGEGIRGLYTYVKSTTPSEPTTPNILGKWISADIRLSEISTIQFEKDGTVIVSGPYGNIRIGPTEISSGEWEIAQGDWINFDVYFSEKERIKATGRIDGDTIKEFKIGGLVEGITLVKSPDATVVETTSKGKFWSEYVYSQVDSKYGGSLKLKIRPDKTFLAIISLPIGEWKIVDSSLVKIYNTDKNGNLIEVMTLEIEGDKLLDKLSGSSYVRQTAVPTVEQPNILGNLWVDKKGKFYLMPLVVYSNGKYRSAYCEVDPEEGIKSKEAKEIMQILQNAKTFTLYYRGTLVGRFEVAKTMLLMTYPNCGGYQQIVASGNILWEKGYVPTLPEVYGDSAMIEDIVALSRPAAKSFSPAKISLSPKQSSDLNMLLQSTFEKDMILLAKKVDYKYFNQAVKTYKYNTIKIMDLNHDGLPEVYASVMWGEKIPDEPPRTDILVTWRNNNWIILMHSTYIEYESFPSVGEIPFSIETVVDIDGDGIDEMILKYRDYEGGYLTLYRLRNEKLEKVLDIGGYGL